MISCKLTDFLSLQSNKAPTLKNSHSVEISMKARRPQQPNNHKTENKFTHVIWRRASSPVNSYS